MFCVRAQLSEENKQYEVFCLVDMNVELLGMCGLGEPSLYSVTGTTALTDSFGGTGQRRLSLTLIG